MASMLFFTRRANIVCGSFESRFRSGHEKFRACLKVPVDRRAKKSNDMTVEVAPEEESRRDPVAARQCMRNENAGVVSIPARVVRTPAA